ncbi:MAG: histidine triad nucleotide-binding protein [Actinomycetota bacterium]|nr:histidine triad nucleotide-binding protein [Actinomycetota bacterium]
MSADCLFCSIVAGRIPATIVDETETTLAFRDIVPVSPTHILVIPKQHVASLDEAAAVDPGIAADVISRCAHVAGIEGLSEGYRVVINNGPNGGQEVGHLHAHVLGGRAHSWPPG